jgi:hypothetical protein
VPVDRCQQFFVFHVPDRARLRSPGHHRQIGDQLPEARLRADSTQFPEPSEQVRTCAGTHGSLSSTVASDPNSRGNSPIPLAFGILPEDRTRFHGLGFFLREASGRNTSKNSFSSEGGTRAIVVFRLESRQKPPLSWRFQF